MATKEQTYLEETIIWKQGTDPEFPYEAESGSDRLLIRLNNFPEENLYTLFVNDGERFSFDDWPGQWRRA